MKHLNIELPDHLLEEMREIAHERRVYVPVVYQEAIEEYLKKEKKKGK